MYENSLEIANKIKERAKEQKLTIKETLLKAGLNQYTMDKYKTSVPSATNLGKIAEALNCSVDYLLGRTENPEINK